MSAFDRNRPLRLILPRCHSCHRYVITWLHAIIFGALGAAGMFPLRRLRCDEHGVHESDLRKGASVIAQGSKGAYSSRLFLASLR